MEMVKRLLILISIIVLLQGCAYWVRYDGPYKGRVVDKETGKPIEGAVVLGVWKTVMHTPAGGVSHYNDAKETVTDEKGEFKISGKGLRILSNLEPMDVLIFKTGYQYLKAPWTALKKGIILRNKITWEGKRAIIPLKKLTMAERRERGSPPDPPRKAPLKKVILMLKEIDKEGMERGIEARGIWNGKRYK
jgi:hypothetical protein